MIFTIYVIRAARQDCPKVGFFVLVASRRALMDVHGIDSLGGLRDLYGPLPEGSLARRIVFPQLHRHHRAFIALSPFVVIASADRHGAPDVSPRGDLPGFV